MFDYQNQLFVYIFPISAVCLLQLVVYFFSYLFTILSISATFVYILSCLFTFYQYMLLVYIFTNISAIVYKNQLLVYIFSYLLIQDVFFEFLDKKYNFDTVCYSLIRLKNRNLLLIVAPEKKKLGTQKKEKLGKKKKRVQKSKDKKKKW